MPKTAAKFRIMAIVGLMLAVMCVPWVRAAPGFPGSASPVAAAACCCGVDGGPCCCAAETDAEGDTRVAAGPDCRGCADLPEDRGGPCLMLLMAGMIPVSWHPGAAVEVISVSAVPNAPDGRLVARALPVPSTALRLALLGVRTT